MDAKKKIQLDSTQGPLGDEECIDISIAFTPACSIYMVLKKGLDEVALDINSMKEAKNRLSIEDPHLAEHVEAINLQIQVASLALTNGQKFLKELEQVITELTPSEKKKPLIYKPSWKG